MRKSLQDALYATYPSIFRQKDLPVTESSMRWGISCADGWYAIIDALCGVLTLHGRENGHPPIEATEVKEKFGSLRFRLAHRCDWCDGARECALAISSHICEETGRQGGLMIQAARRVVRTLAEDVGRQIGFAEAESMPQDRPLADENELPPGWRPIARALRVAIGWNLPDAVVHFSHAEGELWIESESSERWLSGAINCARVLAARTDPVTGAMRIPPELDADKLNSP